MRLIPLTTLNGQFIYVQASNILEIIPSWRMPEEPEPIALPASLLSYVNGETRTVRETPDEIAALCNAPEASPHA